MVVAKPTYKGVDAGGMARLRLFDFVSRSNALASWGERLARWAPSWAKDWLVQSIGSVAALAMASAMWYFNREFWWVVVSVALFVGACISVIFYNVRLSLIIKK